jgi:eukaryotic-like serine/threonine-protein kinase
MTRDQYRTDPERTVSLAGDAASIDVAERCGSIPAIPGYEIIDELGRGGMGIVYRARQAQAHRTVALKMILNRDLARPGELARFRLEAETVARLQHMPTSSSCTRLASMTGCPTSVWSSVPGARSRTAPGSGP